MFSQFKNYFNEFVTSSELVGLHENITMHLYREEEFITTNHERYVKLKKSSLFQRLENNIPEKNQVKESKIPKIQDCKTTLKISDLNSNLTLRKAKMEQASASSYNSTMETSNPLTQAQQSLNTPNDNSNDAKRVLTLLEKAEKFKKSNPDLWKKRDRIRKQRRQGVSLENEKIAKFLDLYYQKIDQALEKKEQNEAEIKLKKPILLLEMKYHPSSPITKEEDERNDTLKLSSKNSSSLEKNDPDNKGWFFLKPAREKFEPVLLISVEKGKNLLNYLSKGKEKWESCKLYCHFYSKLTSTDEVLKSKKAYLTRKGRASWQHSFAFKGFTADDLDSSYVNFVVMGKFNHHKQAIGNVIMSGRNAKIWDESSNTFRSPNKCEVIDWNKAMSKKYPTVNSQIKLNRPIEPTESESSTNSILDFSTLQKLF